MQCIDPLIAGIAGGEDGEAVIYQRGTTTPVTWYEDYDGTNPDTSGDPIPLDSNGGAEVYVDEPVRVVVSASVANGGSTVREWDVMTPSSAVEVVSSSFTGNRYSDGAAGVSRPAWLDAVLDRWLTTNGAIDWQVLVDGETNDIPFFFSKVLGVIFNVKDEEYGAVGDGVTDDTSAITAAITAADSAGGGAVFLPAGTYLTSSQLTVPEGVSIVGTGSDAVSISMDSALGTTLNYSGGSGSGVQVLSGVSLTSEQTCAGIKIFMSTTTRLTISGCHLGDGSLSTGPMIQVNGPGTTARLTVIDCVFESGGGSSDDAIVMGSGTSTVRLSGCRWIGHSLSGVGVAAFLLQGAVFISDCYFDASAVSTGTMPIIDVRANSSALGCSVVGCTFTNGGGATITAMTINMDPGSTFRETANQFGSTVTAYDPSSTTDQEYLDLGSRERRYLYISDNSSTLELPTVNFGVILLERTTGSTVAISAEDVVPLGAKLTLMVHNNGSGGNMTLSLNDSDSGFALSSDIVVADNSVATMSFVAREELTGGSDARWQLVSDEHESPEV